MASVFISYRRRDAGAYARNVQDAIEARLGEGCVFTDREIEPGEDFGERIRDAVGSCDVLVALIGDRWLAPHATGRPRIDDPDDWVRLEIESAFDRRIAVIPVLVGGAYMPQATDLPESVRALAHREAAELTEDRWQQDLDRLLAAITNACAVSAKGGPSKYWRSGGTCVVCVCGSRLKHISSFTELPARVT